MKEKFVLAHMSVAYIYANLSHCSRRKVGCVIVKDDKIISIGYNGTPKGYDNCCEDENGNTIDVVIHAEENALMKLTRSHETSQDASLFVTLSPCVSCAKLIHNAGIKEVFYSEQYRCTAGIEYLQKNNITTIQIEVNR